MEKLNDQAIRAGAQPAPLPTLNLQRRFLACWPGSASESVCAALLERYADPRRRYHNLQHIQECLEWADAYHREGDTVPSPAVDIAIFFHDAVLSPVRSDNELRSFQWFEAQAPADPCLVEQVRRAITATKRTQCPSDTISKLVCDADLAILGAPAGRYTEYAEGIRAEFGAIPGPAFRAARRRFLQGLLESPRLYHLEFFADQLEQQARDNVKVEIAQLSQTVGGAPCGV